MARNVFVGIDTIELSGQRAEHYVCISCDSREMHINRYPGEYLNRALYERDMLRYVLLGAPKPDLMEKKYADPKLP